MSDYIKREDALKTLEQLKDNEEGSLWDDGVDACINDIRRHVPSVELPTKCIAKIEIDNDKLHEIVDNALKGRDLVEVVRCKDCRYYDNKNCKEGLGYCMREQDDGFYYNALHGVFKDNDYCSYGERKDGDK